MFMKNTLVHKQQKERNEFDIIV